MAFLLIYAAGVVVGLAVMRDPWKARLATALAWPLGPMAFVIVVSMMLVAATIVWPVPMLTMWALVAALAWLLL